MVKPNTLDGLLTSKRKAQVADLGQSMSLSLLDVLSNPLILFYTCPLLCIKDQLALASTSRAFQSLIYDTHGTFRHLDLSTVQGLFWPVLGVTNFAHPDLQWPPRNVRNVEDIHTVPLRNVFHVLRNSFVLQDVTTLILDGLVVPHTLVNDILCQHRFNVRLLSLRGVRGLVEEKLIEVLGYQIRTSRPDKLPKLKGLYYFSPRDSAPNLTSVRQQKHTHPRRTYEGVTTSAGSQLGMEFVAYSRKRTLEGRNWAWESPYGALGTIFKIESPKIEESWIQLIKACAGVIFFDAVICYHGQEASWSKRPPRLANIAFGNAGCQNCHSAPEGPRTCGQSGDIGSPILPPVPLHSSMVKTAQSAPTYDIAKSRYYIRCSECVNDRRCEECNAWWCENCYIPPSRSDPKARSGEIKVYHGLCASHCLIEEEMIGAGSGGMWG
ncbi:MAG: hypothetical protein Q9190_000674 [Brigantiaea leucoxantha]